MSAKTCYATLPPHFAIEVLSRQQLTVMSHPRCGPPALPWPAFTQTDKLVASRPRVFSRAQEGVPKPAFGHKGDQITQPRDLLVFQSGGGGAPGREAPGLTKP